MAVKSPSFTHTCTQHECQSHTRAVPATHNQNSWVPSRWLPGSSSTHSLECVEEGSATLRSAIGIRLVPRQFVCGTCCLNVHLANIHPLFRKQCWSKKCLVGDLHGFLHNSLINVDNSFYIGFKTKQTTYVGPPFTVRSHSIHLIPTYCFDRLTDIKKALWELFCNLMRSCFKLIFQPLFLPDLIKWNQTFC